MDIGTPTTTNVRFTVGGLVYASESSCYGNFFDGHISNLRIIKGTALYTGNFTPPARTLTNVTNTKLLCCQSNTQAGAATTATSVGGVNNGTVWSDNFPSTSMIVMVQNLINFLMEIQVYFILLVPCTITFDILLLEGLLYQHH